MAVMTTMVVGLHLRLISLWCNLLLNNLFLLLLGLFLLLLFGNASRHWPGVNWSLLLWLATLATWGLFFKEILKVTLWEVWVCRHLSVE